MGGYKESWTDLQPAPAQGVNVLGGGLVRIHARKGSEGGNQLLYWQC